MSLLLIEETTTDLDFGGRASFFLEKRETILKVEGEEKDGVEDLIEAMKFRGLPSISLTLREVDATKETMLG